MTRNSEMINKFWLIGGMTFIIGGAIGLVLGVVIEDLPTILAGGFFLIAGEIRVKGGL